MSAEDRATGAEHVIGTHTAPDCQSLIASIVCPKRSMPSNARLRWKILSTALQPKTSPPDPQASTPPVGSCRRFESFGLIELRTKCGDNEDNCQQISKEDHSMSTDSHPKRSLLDGKWYECRLWDNRRQSFDRTVVDIKILTERIAIHELTDPKTDNTGNVCLWPSEEVLSYYVHENRSLFTGKLVVELGGGMTCLSGLATAIFTDAKQVVVTDGNQRCVSNVQTIIDGNRHRLRAAIKCRRLVWGEDSHFNDLSGGVDVIVCSDCLYFDDSRHLLVHTIRKLLNSTGIAIILAPKRGQTFERFVRLADEWFDLQIIEDYDQLVTDLHQKFVSKETESHYTPDLHYPVMIRMTNRSSV
ncbi:unnamed protein product [Oppiella nova]|uniref:Calmodulin-lysine N-methyltransferase n=1 Tax=Oppiella nova TaxID=334625 RepID=A0A7R9LXG7_9ACAR|nr:unnamed protein product [Oppiella nova]CAG2167950.1 unnamed protein product [Oppiella nova]